MPFRSRHLLPAAAAALCFVPATPATAASTSATPKPTLGAKLATCVVGDDASGGRAVFQGAMPAIRGARRLAMRFELERRSGDDDEWRRVPAPTFGEWERSRAGVSGFVYSKRVEGLTAPAQYRAVVRFRWMDAKGRRVRRAVRSTPACTQPDPRPNLTLLRLRTAVADTGPVVEVTVRNTGRADTLAPAVVALRAAGLDQPPQTVPPLGPGVTAVVTFPLPACPPGGRHEVSVDPADGIDEAVETDNARSAPCG